MPRITEFLTYREAATRFHVSEWTLYQWARKGLLTKHKRPLDRHIYVSVDEIRNLKLATPRAVEDQK